MDAGQVAEYDTPLALFDRPDSIFRSMCDAAKLTRAGIERIRAGEVIVDEDPVEGQEEQDIGVLRHGLAFVTKLGDGFVG